MIVFEKVKPNKNQIAHLYRLLGDRSHQISHRKVPTFEEHAAFVQKNPYRVWYIVHEDQQMVGSVYLTYQNTIGINIEDRRVAVLLNATIDKIKADFAPLPAVKSTRSGCFSINVAPTNKPLLNALNAGGFLVSQICFEL